MSRDRGYGGTRRGDTALAGKMLFSPDGVTDDELAETLDFDIDGESAVLWCRRQDARKFKRERCAQSGALIFSLTKEGEEKPRYIELTNIPPDDMPRLRQRMVRSLAREVKALFALESNDRSRLGFIPVEDEILETVREMMAAAKSDAGARSA